LGFAFWSAVFFLVYTRKYVDSALLSDTVEPTYRTLDRILREFQCEGNAFCIPPYPKGVYLPEHLKSLQEMVIFIAASANSEMPSFEEMTKGTFQAQTSKGIFVTPPGIGLLDRIEARTKMDLSKIKVEDLCEILPSILQNSFSLAKDIALFSKDNVITLRARGSVYEDLYTPECGLKSVGLFGCPMVNTIEGALAKSSGKPVTIQKLRFFPDTKAIEVSYRIVETGERIG
jgi:hypothetical protein